VAPKAFKEEILFGKTRSQRRTEEIGKKEIPEIVEKVGTERKNTLLNHLSELLFLLDDEAEKPEILEIEPPDGGSDQNDNFIEKKCYECDMEIHSEMEMKNHFTESPLKHFRGNFAT